MIALNENKDNGKDSILDLLIGLNLVSKNNLEIFSRKTRDRNNLLVYIDNKSKIIFIDDFYVGDEEYVSGDYRRLAKNEPSFEDISDSQRRFSSYLQFFAGKTLCDYGCGLGSFLKLSKNVASHVVGIELQSDCRDNLSRLGISSHEKITDSNQDFDLVTLFHCLEHLRNPVEVLSQIHKKLKPDGRGKVIIEVPHARDFLIDKVSNQSFIDSTLWSQHLILHTRESLETFLRAAGFKNILIEGVQRYGLSNHMRWLSNNAGGGHKEVLSILDDEGLKKAYSQALSRIDANDTLVALATT